MRFLLLCVQFSMVAQLANCGNKEPSFWVYGEQYGKKSPPCETACHEHFQKVIGVFFESGNITRSMDIACGHYNQAMECLAPLTQCHEDSFFIPMLSGVHYMCVEQREAFDVLIECVDATSILVRDDCDAECKPANLITGLAVKDTVVQSLDKPLGSNGVNIGAIIEPHVGTIMFSEACRVSECLFTCYKNKFNMLCEGTAGSLLMELISRPLSSTAEAKTFSMPMFLNSFVGGLLPHTCSFLSKKKGGLKIDKELDKEIKRMYRDRKRSSTIDFERSMGVASPAISPFEAMQRSFSQDSPFEKFDVHQQKSVRGDVSFSPFSMPQHFNTDRSFGSLDEYSESDGSAEEVSSGNIPDTIAVSKPQLHLININEEITFPVEKGLDYVIQTPTNKDEYFIECQLIHEDDFEGSGSGDGSSARAM